MYENVPDCDVGNSLLKFVQALQIHPLYHKTAPLCPNQSSLENRQAIAKQ
jgi:hypothetical protein